MKIKITKSDAIYENANRELETGYTKNHIYCTECDQNQMELNKKEILHCQLNISTQWIQMINQCSAQ